MTRLRRIGADGPCPARIMIVSDCPSERDLYDGVPFSGQDGQELGRMIQEAGLLYSQCYRTTLFKDECPGHDAERHFALKKKDIRDDHFYHQGQHCTSEARSACVALTDEIRRCRPTIIVAMGNAALWALTGKWGVGKWRGSMLETLAEYDFGDGNPPRRIKVIPTYSPSQVLRQWSWRPILVRDLKRVAAESNTTAYDVPAYNFIIRPSYSQTLSILDDLYRRVCQRPTKFAVDIETRAGYIACLGIAWSARDAICIPFMVRQDAMGYWTVAEEAEISYRIMKVLTHQNAEVVGQNFIYDTQYIWRHMLFVPRFKRDTMLAQHCMWTTQPKGLDFLASFYCHYYVYWKDEGKEWDPKSTVTEDEFWHYNCKDAVHTYEIDDVQQRVVDAMGLRKPHDFQQAMFYPVLKTMNRGVRIDLEVKKGLSKVFKAQMDEIQQWLTDVLGQPINCKSPPQISKLFYEDLKVSPVKDRKTGRPTTNDAALSKIGSRDALLKPLCDNILKYRSLGVIVSTFLEAEVDEDDRMRCSYNIAGTSTFRFASSKNAFGKGMNLQNNPIESKAMFIPDPGYELGDIDLDSADLRIVVAESGETDMAEWLDAGLKPYIMVAREYYHDNTISKKLPDGSEDPRYRIFKSLCHGTHYLGTPEGMAPKLGLLVAEVDRIQKWYFNRFPRIKQWQERFKAQLMARRYVENVFGNRAYALDRIDGTVFNEMIAWIPQSTVALVINRIYKNLDDYCPDIQVLLQVHDSLTIQYPIAKRDECLAQLQVQSQIILPYARPIIIPTGVKTSTVSWGQCE